MADARKHDSLVLHADDASQRSHALVKGDINITPLIDVMMVLLIIFMVILPATQRGIDVALPQLPPPTLRPEPTVDVVLAIDDSANGPSYSLNQRPMASLIELDGELKSVFQTRQDKTIFVTASGKISYGKVLEAVDIARGAGVERVGLIREKTSSEARGKMR